MCNSLHQCIPNLFSLSPPTHLRDFTSLVGLCQQVDMILSLERSGIMSTCQHTAKFNLNSMYKLWKRTQSSRTLPKGPQLRKPTGQTLPQWSKAATGKWIARPTANIFRDMMHFKPFCRIQLRLAEICVCRLIPHEHSYERNLRCIPEPWFLWMWVRISANKRRGSSATGSHISQKYSPITWKLHKYNFT